MFSRLVGRNDGHQVRRCRARKAVTIIAISLFLSGVLPMRGGDLAAAQLVKLPPSKTTLVRLDGALGPSFQGIGAISGGGGNSRYLIDYPAHQRDQILDYLFKPHYGASLQLLKLEIGGNGNSSDGSEPSIEQVRGRIDCNVGYEFWLAKEAVRRNAHIGLYGLQWSAPAWVRGGGNSLWTAADIQYLLDWLGCARVFHLQIRDLGGWNEHYAPGSALIEGWFVALRRALDTHGYEQVKIVAADSYSSGASGAWVVASDMATNRAFSRVVAALGVHDICGVESQGFSCPGSTLAKQWAASGHKWIWQSELGRTPNTGRNPLKGGPAGLARSLNHAYIDAGVTATLLWPLVEAMPPGLPFSGRGLVVADQPWIGNYRVSLLSWIVAQTTQFVLPGWRFLGGADGRLDGVGSYVTYVAPNRSAWSMVVETSAATKSQRLEVSMRGGPSAHVHVWLTELAGSRQFVNVATLDARDGSFSYQLLPGAVYTFTTTTGQSKADGHPPEVPVSKPMPQRYAARVDDAAMAAFLAPIEGSFQYVGGTLTQTTVGAPVPWTGCDVGFPYAVIGNTNWWKFTIAASVELPTATPGASSPGALLIAGFNGIPKPCDFSGYVFSVDALGRWQISRATELVATIASGRVLGARNYDIALTVVGRHISAIINGRMVASLSVRAPIVGLAGIGSLAFDPVRYTNVSVR